MEAENLTILSERAYRKRHRVSYDTVLGMENAFAAEGCKLKRLSALCHYLNQVIDRCLPNRSSLKRIPNRLRPVQGGYYLYVCMGPWDLERQFTTLKRLKGNGARIILYCFDTWESEYDRWRFLFDGLDPDYLFFAYRQSRDFFSQGYPNVFFLPQSMDGAHFYPRDGKKQRLFMQMGRINRQIHGMILTYLAGHNLEDRDENYLYARREGSLVCPDTDRLAENIGRTYFFVCAPRCLDNPELTGQISDVTARFYEAMACKSLIIGFKPDTYDDLFPADSMVALRPDGSDFEEKIQFYLTNRDAYDAIVDRNYQYVRQHHSWRCRLEALVQAVNGASSLM